MIDSPSIEHRFDEIVGSGIGRGPRANDRATNIFDRIEKHWEGKKNMVRYESNCVAGASAFRSLARTAGRGRGGGGGGEERKSSRTEEKIRIDRSVGAKRPI